MKIRTSELEGIALNWVVAIVQGLSPRYEKVETWEGGRWGIHVDNMQLVDGVWKRTDYGWHEYRPVTDWWKGGPIIEREKIDVIHTGDAAKCEGRVWDEKLQKFKSSYGNTPLVAAMRCYVASKLGDEVDVPDEIDQH